MLKYIVRRLLLIIPVLLGAVIIIFTINFFSTTNPAMIKLGLAANDPEKLAAMEHEMGLDRPYLVQLGEYVFNLCKGDLGDSYVYGKTVGELIGGRVGNTLKISIGSIIIAVCLGIPLGLAAALHQNSVVDYGTSVFAILLNAIPGFLIGVVLMQVFAVKLGWLPVSGADSWKHLILPIVSAGIGPVSQNARMTRSAVLEVIRQDYVRTARAKGIDEGKVISRHVLKNSLIPILTMIGNSLGGAMAGSILVELIFNIPGMGTLISTSINSKDFSTVQGCVVICALVVSVMNLLTDLAYAAVDPRIKAQYAAGSKAKKKANAAKEVA